jgi:hypothetical protein
MDRPFRQQLLPVVLISVILCLALLVAGCSGTKYYNRYPKDKPCKMQDSGAKKARKNL